MNDLTLSNRQVRRSLQNAEFEKRPCCLGKSHQVYDSLRLEKLENMFVILKKGHRAQIDRVLYKRNMQELMLNTKNLTVLPEQVNDIILTNNDGTQIESLGNDTTQVKVAGVILGIYKGLLRL